MNSHELNAAWAKRYNNPTMQRFLERTIKEVNEGIELLTREQFKEALRQAIMSGDFERCVLVDGSASNVTYLPYRKANQLRKEVQELEEKLADATK